MKIQLSTSVKSILPCLLLSGSFVFGQSGFFTDKGDVIPQKSAPVDGTLFPFPSIGKSNATHITDSLFNTNISRDSIQSIYEAWVNKYYEESGDKKRARVKFDNESETVSEGIAYGMLIFVYMDNKTNNTREKFNRLWNYYKSYPNQNGLMHWKIAGFGGPIAHNGATDAEVDAILALAMAYKQWGDVYYLNEARWLADKILAHEVTGDNKLTAGDAYMGRLNPSYFSIVAMEIMRYPEITPDPAKRARWAKVIENSYWVIEKSRRENGYIPDWTRPDGSPDGPYMLYDAIRTQWRMAWAYSWFGDSTHTKRAKEICDRLTNHDVSNPNTFTKNRTYLGAWATAAMTDPSKKEYMLSKYKELLAVKDSWDIYFGKTLNLVYHLLLLGHMPNFWDPQTATYKVTPVRQVKNIPHVNFTAKQKANQLVFNFSTPSSNRITIKVLDIQGKTLAELPSAVFSQGNHSVSLPFSKRSQGLHFAQIQSPEGITTVALPLN